MVRPLSKALQSIAETQLNEIQNERQEKVDHLREWIKKQPHLRCRLEDQWLLTFLRGCKFSLQKVKDKLDCYYSSRSTIPEFFHDRDPLAPEIEEYFKQRLCVQYSVPQEEETPCPIITVLRTQDYDPNKIPFLTALKIALMLIDLMLSTNDRYVIAGEHLIIDLKGNNHSVLTQLTPVMLRKMAKCIHGGYPIKLKGIHCINCPSIFVTIFNGAKPLMPKKIINRVKIYNDENLEEIYKSIPKSMLPKEYGGEAGTLDELADQLKRKLQTHNTWFMEDKNYRSDENKRIEPLKDYESFGVDGSFMQLTID